MPVVYTHTHLQNAIQIRSKRAEDIWHDFVGGWASLYIYYPNIIRLDHEATFRSGFFRKETGTHGIELQFRGTKTQNSIGFGERRHIPLRRVFRITRELYPSLDPEITLRYTDNPSTIRWVQKASFRQLSSGRFQHSRATKIAIGTMPQEWP